jgi:carbon storage regulator CsrA
VLVLTRKVGERILVPEYGLAITVSAVKGGAVRLAISAPPRIDIVRAELRDRVAAMYADPESPPANPRR